MDVGLFASPSVFRWRRRVGVARPLHRRFVVIGVMVHIVMMMGRRRTVRKHDLANAMTIAAFVGMSRRARNDAKLRQSKSQEPGQEATKQDHQGILTPVSYRSLKIAVLANIAQPKQRKGFAQRYWSRGQENVRLTETSVHRRSPPRNPHREYRDRCVRYR